MGDELRLLTRVDEVTDEEQPRDLQALGELKQGNIEAGRIEAGRIEA